MTKKAKKKSEDKFQILSMFTRKKFTVDDLTLFIKSQFVLWNEKMDQILKNQEELMNETKKNRDVWPSKTSDLNKPKNLYQKKEEEIPEKVSRLPRKKII